MHVLAGEANRRVFDRFCYDMKSSEWWSKNDVYAGNVLGEGQKISDVSASLPSGFVHFPVTYEDASSHKQDAQRCCLTKPSQVKRQIVLLYVALWSGARRILEGCFIILLGGHVG